jgi:hypothetical protein
MATELGTVNLVQKWGRSLHEKYCLYFKNNNHGKTAKLADKSKIESACK